MQYPSPAVSVEMLSRTVMNNRHATVLDTPPAALDGRGGVGGTVPERDTKYGVR